MLPLSCMRAQSCVPPHTHTHKMEYYSAIKKKRNIAVWDNMDEQGGYYT